MRRSRSSSAKPEPNSGLLPCPVLQSLFWVGCTVRLLF